MPSYLQCPSLQEVPRLNALPETKQTGRSTGKTPDHKTTQLSQLLSTLPSVPHHQETSCSIRDHTDQKTGEETETKGQTSKIHSCNKGKLANPNIKIYKPKTQMTLGQHKNTINWNQRNMVSLRVQLSCYSRP